jgi:DNA-binding LytR/AlgR family response regulator
LHIARGILARLFAVEIAKEAGFDAISVATADEAITILEERPDVFLVFTDVDIPGSMDGIKLARAVRERWPPVELVVTSGHGEVLVEDLPERGRFLAKPYDASTLTRTFREMAGNVQGRRGPRFS